MLFFSCYQNERGLYPIFFVTFYLRNVVVFNTAATFQENVTKYWTNLILFWRNVKKYIMEIPEFWANSGSLVADLVMSWHHHDNAVMGGRSLEGPTECGSDIPADTFR